MSTSSFAKIAAVVVVIFFLCYVCYIRAFLFVSSLLLATFTWIVASIDAKFKLHWCVYTLCQGF